MSARARSIAILLASAALFAAGCAVHSPPERAEIQEQTGTLPGLGLDKTWRAAPTPPGAIEGDWLSSFGDDQLEALVAEAVVNNADLRVAAVRVEQAAAYVNLAQAALKPQIGIFGTGGLNASGGDASSALQAIAIGISWEPDLWGRLRYARNATRETAASAAADYAFARQSIAANVAKTWFSATAAGLQAQLADSMAASAGELATLAEQRLKVGIGDELDVVTARALQGTYTDSALQLRLTMTQTVRALELLLGRYPAAELAARPELPPLPGAVPVGLPLEMLERRPDMFAAERRVAAAFDRVGEARAARLPRLVLNASISAMSSDVLQLKQDFQNPSAGAGVKLIAPIYTGGALKTQVVIRTLEQKEAVADYARMALRSLGDVEQALASGANLAARANQLERVVTDNQRSLDLANTRYRIGKGDARAVRQQELSLENARVALLAVKSAELAERINLHLALGGSFEKPPEPPAPAADASAPTAAPAGGAAGELPE